MATPPDEVRASLALVTTAAATDVAAVAAAAETPEDARQLLFLATPLIVAQYTDGSSALALEWYEELRATTGGSRTFTPIPVAPVDDDVVRGVVATSTGALRAVPDADEPDAIEISIDMLSRAVEELVADGFRTTITENVRRDPSAVGWRRFARPEACKFCKMLAAKGAVFTAATARFAAHGAVMAGGRKGGNCMCIAGPAFITEPDWTAATPMQYLASRKRRTSKQRAALREYLNENFPDAPG